MNHICTDLRHKSSPTQALSPIKESHQQPPAAGNQHQTCDVHRTQPTVYNGAAGDTEAQMKQIREEMKAIREGDIVFLYSIIIE